jgi:hypothetical protein
MFDVTELAKVGKNIIQPAKQQFGVEQTTMQK